MAGVTTYSDTIAATICEQLAGGKSLREICRDESMPAQSTVFKWLAEQESFSVQYARAREAQAEFMADEILEISDDGSNDWMERQNGDGEPIKVVDHEHISRSKLRVDSRKWLLSKMLPKRYGDKITQEHSGPDGSAQKHEIIHRVMLDGDDGTDAPAV
jgi:hypothetical protein